MVAAKRKKAYTGIKKWLRSLCTCHFGYIIAIVTQITNCDDEFNTSLDEFLIDLIDNRDWYSRGIGVGWIGSGPLGVTHDTEFPRLR